MDKLLTKDEWKKRRKIKRYIRFGILCVVALILFILLITGLKAIFSAIFTPSEKLSDKAKTLQGMLNIKKEYIVKNPNTRSGMALEKVNGIVIHYVGIADQTADERWKYYNELTNDSLVQGSCHYIVGFKGEIIQCIPEDELALASAKRNSDTISIEYTHSDYEGRPGEKTYNELVKLTAFLMEKYNLQLKDILRHSDITGYQCPPYFTEDQDAWSQFLIDVQDALDQVGRSGI